MQLQASRRICPVILRRDFHWIGSANGKQDDDVRCERFLWRPPKHLLEKTVLPSTSTTDKVLIVTPVENPLPPCNPIYCPYVTTHLVQSLHKSNEIKCSGDQAQASPTSPSTQSQQRTELFFAQCVPPFEPLKYSEPSKPTFQEINPAPYHQCVDQCTIFPQNLQRQGTVGKPKEEVLTVLTTRSPTSSPTTPCRYGGQTIWVKQVPRSCPPPRLPPPCEQFNNPCFDKSNTQPPPPPWTPKKPQVKKPCGFCARNRRRFEKGSIFLLGLLVGGAIVGLYNKYYCEICKYFNMIESEKPKSDNENPKKDSEKPKKL